MIVATADKVKEFVNVVTGTQGDVSLEEYDYDIRSVCAALLRENDLNQAGAAAVQRFLPELHGIQTGYPRPFFEDFTNETTKIETDDYGLPTKLLKQYGFEEESETVFFDDFTRAETRVYENDFDTPESLDDFSNGIPANGDIFIEDEELVCKNTTGQGGSTRAIYALKTEVGKRYSIRVDLKDTDLSGGNLAASNNQDGTAPFVTTGEIFPGSYYITFAAQATTAYIVLAVFASTDNASVRWDNFKVTERISPWVDISTAPAYTQEVNGNMALVRAGTDACQVRNQELTFIEGEWYKVTLDRAFDREPGTVQWEVFGEGVSTQFGQGVGEFYFRSPFTGVGQQRLLNTVNDSFIVVKSLKIERLPALRDWVQRLDVTTALEDGQLCMTLDSGTAGLSWPTPTTIGNWYSSGIDCKALEQVSLLRLGSSLNNNDYADLTILEPTDDVSAALQATSDTLYSLITMSGTGFKSNWDNAYTRELIGLNGWTLTGVGTLDYDQETATVTLVNGGSTTGERLNWSRTYSGLTVGKWYCVTVEETGISTCRFKVGNNINQDQHANVQIPPGTKNARVWFYAAVPAVAFTIDQGSSTLGRRVAITSPVILSEHSTLENWTPGVEILTSFGNDEANIARNGLSTDDNQLNSAVAGLEIGGHYLMEIDFVARSATQDLSWYLTTPAQTKTTSDLGPAAFSFTATATSSNMSIGGTGTGANPGDVTVDNVRITKTPLENSTFDTDLTGWSVTTGGTSTVAWEAPGGVRLNRGDTACSVQQDAPVTTGDAYELEVVVTESSGDLRIYEGEISGPGQKLAVSAPGTYKVTGNIGSAGTPGRFFAYVNSGNHVISALIYRPKI